MATPIVALLQKHKETQNKIQYRETDETDGLIGTLYVSKVGVRTQLDGAETITVLVEAGDQRRAA